MDHNVVDIKSAQGDDCIGAFLSSSDTKSFFHVTCIPPEQGYDPFNPEVVRPQEQQNGKSAASGDITGALELVNKAIEEVRCEVEREKRKLSLIGDEQYNPSESTSLSSSEAAKSKAASSHLGYDPGTYQITPEDYNLAPSCSKYTLDSDNQGNNNNSMEYIPTSLKKPSVWTQLHKQPSPPPSPKYSNSTASPKCKYTLDNSKPSTDMEYDPLSNYSARIAVKSKRGEGAQPVKTGGSEAHKLPGIELPDEEYVVAVKKPWQPKVDLKKYTISDSDGESSGTEYRPTSLSNLQQRKGIIGSAGNAFEKDRKERTESGLGALTQRNKEELAQDSDSQEDDKQKDNLVKKKVADRTSQEKRGKPQKVHKLESEIKKSSSKSSSGSKEKGSVKSSNQDSAKKENKSHGKKDDKKDMSKVKTSEKVQREGRDEKRGDGKIKTGEKMKRDSSKQDKDSRESKKLKTSDREKEREHSKHKDYQVKNGQTDSIKKEKDIKKISKSSSSSSKGSSDSRKDKLKQSISSSNGKRLEDKRQSSSLSHADLFGDESPDEAEPVEMDYDDYVEEVLVRKSADALKRGRLNKRKASERTPSSSEDESDRNLECSRTGPDKVDFDFSRFQEDIDFDSDPMEECLRIFNESKVVKREDKGRQVKQVQVFGFFLSFFSYILHSVSVTR